MTSRPTSSNGSRNSSVYPLDNLLATGLEVVATFRTLHVTIAFTDLDRGLQLLDE